MQRSEGERDGTSWRPQLLQHGGKVLALVLTTLVAACSSGNATDDAVPPLTTSSALVNLTVVTYPGFTPPSPPSSKCETATYPSTQSVGATSHELTWDYCGLNANFTHAALDQGSRMLTDAEFQSVVDALHHVAVTHGNGCGEDASVVTLDVQNEDGIDRFANDFYAGCPGDLQAGRTFASGLEDLAQITQTLASSGNSGR